VLEPESKNLTDKNPSRRSKPLKSEAPIVLRRLKVRKGRGFSVGEIKEAGLNVRKARLLEISVDTRRDTVHEENVKMVKEIATSTEREGCRSYRPKMFPKRFSGRVYRGLTSAGKKMRGLKS